MTVAEGTDKLQEQEDSANKIQDVSSEGNEEEHVPLNKGKW